MPLNISKTIEALRAVHDDIRGAILEREHVFKSLTKSGDVIVSVDIPTGQLPNAAAMLLVAITNLQGHLAKAGEIHAANEMAKSHKAATPADAVSDRTADHAQLNKEP